MLYRQGGTSRGCALPQRSHAGCSTAREAQHCAVRYCPGCSTAREAQHCAVRYCQRGPALRHALLPERHRNAPRCVPLESIPVSMIAPALSFPDSGLHARGATPTGRRPPMHFLHRPRKLGRSSRVNLPLRCWGTQGRKRHKPSRRDGQELVVKI